VLSGRGLWDGPIPRPEESYYRLWCMSECDQVKINNLDTCCEWVTSCYKVVSAATCFGGCRHHQQAEFLQCKLEHRRYRAKSVLLCTRCKSPRHAIYPHKSRWTLDTLWCLYQRCSSLQCKKSSLMLMVAVSETSRS
jgi:hypothetical protein